MKCLFFLLSLVATPCLGQTAIPIVYSIPIQNASFEQPATGYQDTFPPCGGSQVYSVPGWSDSRIAAGLSSGSSTVVPDVSCGVQPPDGKQFLQLRYFDGPPASISQDLGDVYVLLPKNQNGQDTVGFYTLKFWVADVFYWYDGQFAASLTLQKTLVARSSTDTFGVLCSTNGFAGGDFAEITMICPSQRRYGELILSLFSQTPNWGVLFDKVSLTFTPTTN